MIESFTQIENDLDLDLAKSGALGKDTTETEDGGAPNFFIWWYERRYEPPPPPFSPFTKIVRRYLFDSGYPNADAFLDGNDFQNVAYGLDLWGEQSVFPVRYPGLVAWVGNFPTYGCYMACRSKVRIVSASPGIHGALTWIIPRVCWTADFTFTYDATPFISYHMVLSTTAAFVEFFTLIEGKWQDVLPGGFGDFPSSDRLRIMIIGETPEAWQLRTGITLTNYP